MSKHKIHLSMADAPSADPALTIDLPEPDHIEVDGKPVELDDLAGLVKEACSNGELIMIRVAAGMDAEEVGPVIKAVAQAGGRKVSVEPLVKD